MLEMIEDLTGDTLISRSKVVNHPEYSKPVLMVQYGWKNSHRTVWDNEVQIKEIPCHT